MLLIVICYLIYWGTRKQNARMFAPCVCLLPCSPYRDVISRPLRTPPYWQLHICYRCSPSVAARYRSLWDVTAAIMFAARLSGLEVLNRGFFGVGTLWRRGVEMEDRKARRERAGAAATTSGNGGEVLWLTVVWPGACWGCSPRRLLLSTEGLPHRLGRDCVTPLPWRMLSHLGGDE